MTKVIIFDFFDVIRTDAFKAWMNAHEYKMEGPFLDAVQSMDRGEIDTKEFLQRLGSLSGQSADAVFEDMEANTSIDYDVLALIEKLRSQYKIGLLSNAPSQFLRGLLKEYDLEKYFDVIVISSEIGLIKPSPEIFQHILSMMEIEPSEAIFIDDNEKNVAGAEAVGIKSFVYMNVTKLQDDLAANGVILS